MGDKNGSELGYDRASSQGIFSPRQTDGSKITKKKNPTKITRIVIKSDNAYNTIASVGSFHFSLTAPQAFSMAVD